MENVLNLYRSLKIRQSLSFIKICSATVHIDVQQTAVAVVVIAIVVVPCLFH